MPASLHGADAPVHLLEVRGIDLVRGGKRIGWGAGCVVRAPSQEMPADVGEPLFLALAPRIPSNAALGHRREGV
ncbi:MAG: hypothetical protein U5J83_09050 [Bryobacterales bacterium]|nr:hypothetical protein [Bryobacterales bacterium]